MMRLGRRATLLVALLLLTSAATAYAECAWVLWEDVTTFDARGEWPHEWSIIIASPNPQDCQNFRAAATKDRADRWRNIPRPPGADPTTASPGPSVKSEGNQVTVSGASGVTSYRYLCLPDTVDPRGPKGK
jgi:hypothetical protein